MDISSFAVVNTAPARLDQVGKAVGGPWGSTNVDKQFEGYLTVSWAFGTGRSPLAREMTPPKASAENYRTFFQVQLLDTTHVFLPWPCFC